MILSPETLAFLMTAALVAGCIDAMAGGGGLIALPALLAAGVPPVPAVATNKLQSSLGTFGACIAYARAGHMDLKAFRWPIIAAFIGSVGGAWLIQRVSPAILAGLMPALLIALAAYFTFSPKVSEMDRHSRVGIVALSLLIGGIGFYDGFFGPGAGAFYTTIFVALGRAGAGAGNRADEGRELREQHRRADDDDRRRPCNMGRRAGNGGGQHHRRPDRVASGHAVRQQADPAAVDRHVPGVDGQDAAGPEESSARPAFWIATQIGGMPGGFDGLR